MLTSLARENQSCMADHLNRCAGADECFAATWLTQGSWLNAQLFGQSLPFCVHFRLGFFVHGDLVRPRARKTFCRPFPGGVDAHLGAVVRQTAGMIERVD